MLRNALGLHVANRVLICFCGAAVFQTHGRGMWANVVELCARVRIEGKDRRAFKLAFGKILDIVATDVPGWTIDMLAGVVADFDVAQRNGFEAIVGPAHATRLFQGCTVRARLGTSSSIFNAC